MKVMSRLPSGIEVDWNSARAPSKASACGVQHEQQMDPTSARNGAMAANHCDVVYDASDTRVVMSCEKVM